MKTRRARAYLRRPRVPRHAGDTQRMASRGAHRYSLLSIPRKLPHTLK